MTTKNIIERDVKKAVKKCLDEIGAYHHWPVQTGYGKRCLDCHGCYKGLYFSIETKRPGEKPTGPQETIIATIRAAGGLVLVIDTPEAARELGDHFKSYAASFGAVHRPYPRAVD